MTGVTPWDTSALWIIEMLHRDLIFVSALRWKVQCDPQDPLPTHGDFTTSTNLIIAPSENSLAAQPINKSVFLSDLRTH